MARPIETVVECRQELVALSATYEQAGWKFKIEGAFPRWRQRTEQRLAQLVSLKASTHFAALNPKPRPGRSETWIDVVAMHLSFLEELVNDVQVHPEDYGASVIAHERRITTAARDRERAARKEESSSGPRKVTLSWLFNHLSGAVVAFYLGSLLIAFALGFVFSRARGVGRATSPAAGSKVDSVRSSTPAPR
jgi:hypothetical protein